MSIRCADDVASMYANRFTGIVHMSDRSNASIVNTVARSFPTVHDCIDYFTQLDVQRDRVIILDNITNLYINTNEPIN